jgi:hypothetical protein
MMSFDTDDDNGIDEGMQQTLPKQPSMGKVQFVGWIDPTGCARRAVWLA